MARLEVYRNSGDYAEHVPYLLDVQSEVLSSLDTRVVIPLRRRDSLPALRFPANLMPEVLVEGISCLVETPKLAAVPLGLINGPPVAVLADKHFEITAALDFLFQGY